jgi:hypothetical protein
MTSLSDTLTVGLVLVLLFGSIALYLYTRIQQAEQKISLLEGILLDLKMSTEVKSYTELPAHEESVTKGGMGADLTEAYIPYGEDDEEDENEAEDSKDNYYPGAVVKAYDDNKSPSPSPSVSSRTVDADSNEVDQYKSIIADAIKDDSESKAEDVLPNTSKVSVNYEAMTLKELQNLAKSRGITGAGSMKKGQIIEALKTSDRPQTNAIEPGSFGISGSTFLETSSTFLEQDSK